MSRMAAKMDIGGFDCDPVEKAPPERVCPICLLLLRDPVLTSCCGNHFCQSCIRPVQAKGKHCPLCNQGKVTTMLDKFFQRKVLTTRVRCPYAKHGCSWVGELQQVELHTDRRKGNCSSITAPCAQCGESVKLCDMATHWSEACPERPFVCEYCDKRGVYRSISTKHWPICERYPLCCPKECGEKSMPRGELSEHLDKDCPLGIVRCKFSFAGCEVSTSRKEMSQHLESATQSHLLLMATQSQEIRSQLKSKDLKIEQLESEILSKEARINRLEVEMRDKETRMDRLERAVSSGLKTNEAVAVVATPTATRASTLNHVDSALTPAEVRCVPVELIMEDFFSYQDHRQLWYSKAFYSHSGGYRFGLSVYANGTDEGEERYVSAYVHLMRGDYDAYLAWPFYGVVYVKITNLLQVNSVYTKFICEFNPAMNYAACQQVFRPNIRNEQGSGCGTLLPHDCLPRHEVQSLNFLIYHVDIHH